MIVTTKITKTHKLCNTIKAQKEFCFGCFFNKLSRKKNAPTPKDQPHPRFSFDPRPNLTAVENPALNKIIIRY